MRAKFIVENVEKNQDDSEQLTFRAVGQDQPYGPNGESEDSDFARWTPSGNLTMRVNNPELYGKIQIGEKYYLDFTKAE